ncbi:MAG: tRNA preQ1(34) S-adenosylmethionine ribosyltransferase-isomerase QueA [Gammaproteobacteria bacterium]|nr:tRNA preQ1(34) S-adenosylmethionine ribosyltransferase-isomerase QueA [Gammaproteobacteria bacterium]
MKKSDYYFELPQNLIADRPAKQRTKSRLLVVNPVGQQIHDGHFFQLPDWIRPNDCLIFNDTRVIPARLSGKKETGGVVEVMIERIRIEEGVSTCMAQIRASNPPQENSLITIADDFILKVINKEGRFYQLANLSGDLLHLVEKYGSIPLPPYINRLVEAEDLERYQTVYSKNQGAVAAPTAGLHFDQSLMQQLADKGVEFGFVTLHVGAGTFLPVQVDDIENHQMHSEWYEVPESVVQLVKQTRENNGRVIAVGTTSLRCLEAASQSGQLKTNQGETDIFIYPGYQFKTVDALITNFHLSESTLLMLVSAFAGRDFILNAYQHAIDNEYRFFSYGDAMFIENRIE